MAKEIIVGVLDGIGDSAIAYPLMLQLRPHLSEPQFTAYCRLASIQHDYKIYGAFDEQVCLGLLGVRHIVDLLHGPHLYIDDLVVEEKFRSQGVGASLPRLAEQLAVDAGANGVRLCTGIDSWPARRFYENEGWEPRAVAYKKGFP